MGPAQVPDYLGLTGDPVDCIPGVRGLGPKTASSLLAKYDGLDAIYGNLDQVSQLKIRGSKSIAAKLSGQSKDAFLSKELATVSDTATFNGRGAQDIQHSSNNNMLEFLERRHCKPELKQLLVEFGIQESSYTFRQACQMEA